MISDDDIRKRLAATNPPAHNPKEEGMEEGEVTDDGCECEPCKDCDEEGCGDCTTCQACTCCCCECEVKENPAQGTAGGAQKMLESIRAAVEAAGPKKYLWMHDSGDVILWPTEEESVDDDGSRALARWQVTGLTMDLLAKSGMVDETA